MPFVNSLGALTGNQAMQQVKAGVPAIYLSGWQGGGRRQMIRYRCNPDQSLYATTSVPTVVKRINNALARARTRSRPWKARATSTGTRRSWQMPSRASAAC